MRKYNIRHFDLFSNALKLWSCKKSSNVNCWNCTKLSTTHWIYSSTQHMKIYYWIWYISNDYKIGMIGKRSMVQQHILIKLFHCNRSQIRFKFSCEYIFLSTMYFSLIVSTQYICTLYYVYISNTCENMYKIYNSLISDNL